MDALGGEMTVVEAGMRDEGPGDAKAPVEMSGDGWLPRVRGVLGSAGAGGRAAGAGCDWRTRAPPVKWVGRRWYSTIPTVRWS